MKEELRVDCNKIPEGLDEDQEYLYVCLAILVMHNEGAGCARAEFMSKTLDRINNGEFADSEWFAMMNQADTIIKKATNLSKGKEIVMLTRVIEV